MVTIESANESLQKRISQRITDKYERKRTFVICIGCSKKIHIKDPNYFRNVHCSCGYHTPTQSILLKTEMVEQ